MATDPTQTIQHHENESALAVDATNVARRLAALSPSTDVPIVTVSLDWRIEGTNPGRQPDEHTQPSLTESNRDGSKRPQVDEGEQSARRRPSFRYFEEKMEDLVESHGPRGDVFDSLSGDKERIANYLESEIDPGAHGVFIVSCSAKGIFEAVPFGLPLPNRITTGPTVALSDLVRLDEDFPTYLVLLADQKDALLSFITQATTERSVSMEGDGYPVKQSQGGWSQRRFQNRADERVEAFARDVAEETRKEVDNLGVESIVIAGDEVITSVLEESLHESVRDKVVGNLRLDIRALDHEIVEATLPLAEKAERARENEAVQRVSDGIGAGTYGAGGASDVLTALQAGQVETLVMVDDFEAQGWADFDMPAYGAGDLPTTHPLGGDTANIVAVDLREEMIRLAIQMDADVEIVHTDVPDDEEDFETVPQAGGDIPRSDAAIALDKHDGVGAILRYVIGDEPSEEESAAQAQDRDKS